MSTLSFPDMVRIVAHFNTLYSDKKIKSDDELRQRGYNQAAIDALRKQRQDGFITVESCGLRFKSAFHNTKYGLFGYLDQLYALYQKGVLPFPGSTSEQPGQIMEMFGLMDSLHIEKYNQEAKKRK